MLPKVSNNQVKTSVAMSAGVRSGGGVMMSFGKQSLGSLEVSAHQRADRELESMVIFDYVCSMAVLRIDC